MACSRAASAAFSNGSENLLRPGILEVNSERAPKVLTPKLFRISSDSFAISAICSFSF